MQVLRSLPARLVTLLALVLAGVPAAPASAAATVVVPLSARGTPSRTTVAPGTILAFRNEDRIARSVRSSTPNWSFAVAMIRPGQTFTLRSALTVPADYRYSSRDRLHPTTAFDGTVRVAPRRCCPVASSVVRERPAQAWRSPRRAVSSGCLRCSRCSPSPGWRRCSCASCWPRRPPVGVRRRGCPHPARTDPARKDRTGSVSSLREHPPATDRPWPMSPQEEVGLLRHYELMVILDPDLEERTISPSLDTFLNVVRTGGGTVEKVDIWGRRRLAFEIDKKSEGIYAVIDLRAEPATMKELDRQLNLNEAILRTKVLRPELR